MPKINDLPQVDNLSTEANIPITQDGVTYKANVSMLGSTVKRVETLVVDSAEAGWYVTSNIKFGEAEYPFEIGEALAQVTVTEESEREVWVHYEIDVYQLSPDGTVNQYSIPLKNNYNLYSVNLEENE